MSPVPPLRTRTKFLGDFPRSGIRNKQGSDIEFFLILPKLRKILHTLRGPTHEQIQSI